MLVASTVFSGMFSELVPSLLVILPLSARQPEGLENQ